MIVLVTGSAGHLGEALMRSLPLQGHRAIGLDVTPSAFTREVGSITDRSFVRKCMRGVQAVVHAATLHKPHVATHSRRDFVDVNISGTLSLLEEATASGVRAFVFTSTTSTFGGALTPPSGAPAAWITEEVVPVPRNIYGVTKVAAESLCELFHRSAGLPCLILRTSRFFPEPDDRRETRQAYEDGNAKANEFLYRRVEIEDVVSAHLLALERAPALGFGRYIISATTPFTRAHLPELRTDAPAVVRRLVPGYEEVYRRRGWSMLPASTASTSTIARGASWGGSHDTTSPTWSICSVRAGTIAATWRGPLDRRGTTPGCSRTGRTPWNSDTALPGMDRALPGRHAALPVGN